MINIVHLLVIIITSVIWNRWEMMINMEDIMLIIIITRRNPNEKWWWTWYTGPGPTDDIIIMALYNRPQTSRLRIFRPINSFQSLSLNYKRLVSSTAATTGAPSSGDRCLTGSQWGGQGRGRQHCQVICTVTGHHMVDTWSDLTRCLTLDNLIML